jgi:hypothetical protein
MLELGHATPASTLGICQVCAILDGDRGLKAVRWCATCGAWICEYCRSNWDRRVRAAFREFF